LPKKKTLHFPIVNPKSIWIVSCAMSFYSPSSSASYFSNFSLIPMMMTISLSEFFIYLSIGSSLTVNWTKWKGFKTREMSQAETGPYLFTKRFSYSSSFCLYLMRWENAKKHVLYSEGGYIKQTLNETLFWSSWDLPWY